MVMTILPLPKGIVREDGKLRGFVYDGAENRYLVKEGRGEHGYDGWYIYM